MFRIRLITLLVSVFLLFTRLVVTTGSATGCHQDNCYRALSNRPAAATSFCRTFTTGWASQGIPTASPPPFTSQCANSPQRISSACSCLVPAAPDPTAVTSGVCEPTPAMDATRNGGFDQVFIPEGGTTEVMPPWYFHDLNLTRGYFMRLPYDVEERSETGYGAAAWHMDLVPPANDPYYVPGGYLSAEISICSGQTYNLSFWGRTESSNPNPMYPACFIWVHSALVGPQFAGARLFRPTEGDWRMTRWSGWELTRYTPDVEPVVDGIGREGSIYEERGYEFEGRGWRGWGWNDTLTFELRCYEQSPVAMTAVVDGIRLIPV